jgi:hypothetical protein
MIRFSKLALILGFLGASACSAAPDEGGAEASRAAEAALTVESRTGATALLKHVPPPDRLDFTAELDDGRVQAINKCGQAACLCTGTFCADLIAAGYCEDFHCALEGRDDYTTGAKPPANTSDSPQCICIFPDSSD